MSIFFTFLFSIFATALQLTIMPRLAILSVVPNLILAGVIAWAICQQENQNWLILIPILIFDLIAGRPFGLMTLSLFLVLFFVEFLGSIFLKKNDWPAILFLIFLGVLFFEFCQILFNRLFAFWNFAEPMNLSPFYFYAVLPITLLYNIALSSLFLWGLNKINLFKDDRPFAKFK